MQLVAGGLLGMLGQAVRVIAGLKKAADTASANNKTLGDIFSAKTLAISLLIGFTSGSLALLTASTTSNATADFTLDKSTIAALIASGYAGTDFIEAFMKKYLPA